MAEPRGRILLSDLYAAVREPDRLCWERLREGVEICRLYDGGPSGPVAALLRYAPGASVPRHRHAGLELIAVLHGQQADEYGAYPAGTLYASPPGSAHAVASEQGCVVLAVWERPVEFVE